MVGIGRMRKSRPWSVAGGMAADTGSPQRVGRVSAVETCIPMETCTWVFRGARPRPGDRWVAVAIHTGPA